MNEEALYRLLGQRIRAQRSQSGMTQSELADQIGLLRTSVANIEAGRQKTPIHVLYNLCAVLGVEVRDIVPTSAELDQPEAISVQIEGQMKEVPPKAAEMLNSLLRH